MAEKHFQLNGGFSSKPCLMTPEGIPISGECHQFHSNQDSYNEMGWMTRAHTLIEQSSRPQLMVAGVLYSTIQI